MTTGTLCVESAPVGLLEEPELPRLPTLEALGERIGGCTPVMVTGPARPGDGTDEFGDWTVLLEGGLGWPWSTLASFLTILSSMIVLEQSISGREGRL